MKRVLAAPGVNSSTMERLILCVRPHCAPEGGALVGNYSVSIETLTGNLSISSKGEVFWT